TRLKLGEGAMGLVAQTHQPLIIPEYREWTGRAAPYEAVEVHAVMVAPLLIGGRLVGAIAVMDENPARQFGEADLRLVNLFTPHAAIAIENASLYTSAQREKQYFEAVVLNSPVAIVTLDLDQNITACNPAFSKLFGYTAEDAVGRNLDELISTEAARSQAVDYTREAFHRVVHAFAQRRRKDGTLIDVEVSAVPVTVEGERVAIMALYHDVSELLRARQEAEAANRAKSQFLASMSHELRTPLNAIIGYSEMLVEEAGDQGHESFVLDLQKIRSAGKHLLALINDILDLSKIEAGKTELFIESFDPANLVREVATTVEPLVAKNANRLVMRLEPGLGTMRSDITKVRQVLLNLLSNACKFTEKGTLTLSAGRGGGERGDWITFAVEDTGVGMTAEQLGKVFEAFAQADPSITRKYGGTGLGLAITRRFCHMMGGEIDAAGEAGRGCKFTVRLPAKLSSAETPAAPLRAGGPGEGEVLDRDTILVIDDDPAALELMTRLLTGEGFAVVTAASGDLGLQLAKQLRPLAITLDV
ncbi:MAG: ATP-binding protein, partial [Actinomycetota bacterium]